MIRYKVIVTHSLGFFSDYEIESNDYHTAERKAIETFIDQFCGGTLETTFRGVKETHTVTAFTIDKYKQMPIGQEPERSVATGDD